MSRILIVCCVLLSAGFVHAEDTPKRAAEKAALQKVYDVLKVKNDSASAIAEARRLADKEDNFLACILMIHVYGKQGDYIAAEPYISRAVRLQFEANEPGDQKLLENAQAYALASSLLIQNAELEALKK